MCRYAVSHAAPGLLCGPKKRPPKSLDLPGPVRTQQAKRFIHTGYHLSVTEQNGAYVIVMYFIYVQVYTYIDIYISGVLE